VTAIGHDIPLIMLSNAAYSAYDRVNAAGWSRAIVETLLRHDLGFKGVTITDSLDGAAHSRGVSTASLATLAAKAGTDMILTTGSETTSRTIYAKLLLQARQGLIGTSTLLASYERIRALKAGL
jgi:beta-N-acetylhexosaminidase